MSARRRSLSAFVLVTLLSSALSLLVYLLDPLNLVSRLENATFDLRTRATAPPAPDDIVLVYISENSLDHYKFGAEERIGWPWPRDFYANILWFLKNAGARKVLFDMTFDSPERVEGDDKSFTQAIRESGNVYVACLLESNSPRSEAAREAARQADLKLPFFGLKVEDQGTIRWRSAESAQLPLDYFLGEWSQDGQLTRRHLAGLFDAISLPDTDGVERRYPVLTRHKNVYVPSLALAAILRNTDSLKIAPATDLRIGERPTVPLDEQGRIVLRYYDSNRWFKNYQAHTLVEPGYRIKSGEPYSGSIRPESFKDKFVLIGASAPALFDHVATPIDPKQPGVEVHATALANLLHNEFIRRAEPAWTFGLMLLYCFLGCAIFRHARITWSCLAALALPALHGAAAFALFQRHVWLDIVGPAGAVGVSLTVCMIANYMLEGRQKRALRHAFSQYVAPQVVQKVTENPKLLSLRGEKKVLTCLFMDLAGFTKTSESLPPERIVDILNAYHNEATEAIFRTRGTLDKYVADAVVAFWGDPERQEDHALRACRAALDIQRLFSVMTTEVRLQARIGINSGEMIVGNMGSTHRFNYTVIGDEVNLASRLEGANKAFGTQILISQATRSQAGEAVVVRKVGRVRVVGKERPVLVFELMGLRDQADERLVVKARRFEQAWEAFGNRDWARARDLFGSEDKLAQLCAKRCDELLQTPPPNDWEEITELDSK